LLPAFGLSDPDQSPLPWWLVLVERPGRFGVSRSMGRHTVLLLPLEPDPPSTNVGQRQRQNVIDGAECARAEFLHLLDLQDPRPSRSATEYTLEVRLERVLDLNAERLQRVGLHLDAVEDTLAGFTTSQRIRGLWRSSDLKGCWCHPCVWPTA
jgi:hypothetical protein